MNPAKIELDRPLLITPLMFERVWGANRLHEYFGKDLPPGKIIGESWELSDRDEAQSIICGGAHDRQSLKALLAAHPDEIYGGLAAQKPARFPLLAKYVDAQVPLSIQVHPNDLLAQKYNDRGKNECWVVLQAEPGAEIIRGLKPGVTKNDYLDAVATGHVRDLLCKFVPSPGDVVAIPAGMIHSIGGGVLVAELQQNSDLTFRIDDYNRPGLDGKPRKLHLAEALECLSFDAQTNASKNGAFYGDMRLNTVSPYHRQETGNCIKESLLNGNYFSLSRITLTAPTWVGGSGSGGGIRPRTVLEVCPEAPRVLMALSGSGKVGPVNMCAGETALIPACAPAMEIIASWDGLCVAISQPHPASC